MRSIATFFILFFCLSAHAIDRNQINELLIEKNLNLSSLEAQGMQLFFGERTGGGKSLPFSKVAILITQDEAILKREMVNVNLNKGELVKHLESFQAGGRHIEAREIVGIIFQ